MNLSRGADGGVAPECLQRAFAPAVAEFDRWTIRGGAGSNLMQAGRMVVPAPTSHPILAERSAFSGAASPLTPRRQYKMIRFCLPSLSQ